MQFYISFNPRLDFFITMRISRHKAFKKSLRFFKAAFDYVDPYHVVVDPSFIDSSVKGNINLNVDLSQLLSGRVTPMVTECIMQFLRKNGRTNTPALLIGKACYRLKCGHMGSTCISPSECVLAQLGTENPRHFLVATQEDDLKAKARIVAGTPVLSIHGNLLMLESPSEESRKLAEHRESKRRLPKLSETIAEESSSGSSDEDVQEGASKKKKKARKGKKGVNPLACKKRKTVEPPTAARNEPKRVRSKRPRNTLPRIAVE